MAKAQRKVKKPAKIKKPLSSGKINYKVDLPTADEYFRESKPKNVPKK